MDDLQRMLHQNLQQKEKEHSASGFLKKIQALIEGAKTQVKEDEEVVAIYYPGDGSRIILTELYCRDPYLVILSGTDPEGNTRSFYVHVVSLGLEVARVKKQVGEPNNYSIGFRYGDARESY